MLFANKYASSYGQDNVRQGMAHECGMLSLSEKTIFKRKKGGVRKTDRQKYIPERFKRAPAQLLQIDASIGRKNGQAHGQHKGKPAEEHPFAA